MAGYSKTFANHTHTAVDFCVFIRAGENLSINRDMIEFVVAPGETKSIPLPDDAGRPFLNGVIAVRGDSLSKQAIVAVKSDAVDNLLNMNDTITLTRNGNDLELSGSNG